MPYSVVKKDGPRPWKIINRNTGKVLGSSRTKAQAQASVRARYDKEKSGGR